METLQDKLGALRDWFKKEKWVDLRRPKKDGGYEACGRGDTSKGKKPVCTPANKAKSIDKKERTQRLKEKAKKEKEPNPDKKPNVTKYTEQAGGKATDGFGRIMEIQPTELHQRVPFFCGSYNMVEKAEEFMKNSK